MPPWLLGFQYAGDTPGARLRKARLAKNMTIADLVSVTGLGKPTIYKLEADKATAQPPCMRILAGTLGVSIAYLGKYENLPENTLGQKIKKARLYHGYTKAEFSRQMGVDVKTLRCWESGERRPLDRHYHQLEKYLSVLNPPISQQINLPHG